MELKVPLDITNQTTILTEQGALAFCVACHIYNVYVFSVGQYERDMCSLTWLMMKLKAWKETTVLWFRGKPQARFLME